MGWPKGVPRKKKVEPVLTPEPNVDAVKINEGAIISEKSVDEILSTSYAYPSRMPTLASRESDPFTKYKTDEKNFAYRALNKKPMNLAEREAQGWETIPGSEYGDLILAKMPRDRKDSMNRQTQEKTKAQTQATTERFKEEAARSGVTTFEEK
jgi:hypothetical protein